ncbi:MAG: RDD family protein [Novosphingobium sp.]
MQQYGGFWIRVGAYLIDAIVLAIAGGVVGGIIGAVIGLVMASSGGGSGDIAAAAGLVGQLVGIIINWLYFGILESSSWQATLGKKAVGLVVTDEQGRRISFGRATGRYFAKIISALILLIGFMMVGWTQRKQGLHDMIAGTLVWKAGSPDMVTQDASVFS